MLVVITAAASWKIVACELINQPIFILLSHDHVRWFDSLVLIHVANRSFLLGRWFYGLGIDLDNPGKRFTETIPLSCDMGQSRLSSGASWLIVVYDLVETCQCDWRRGSSFISLRFTCIFFFWFTCILFFCFLLPCMQGVRLKSNVSVKLSEEKQVISAFQVTWRDNLLLIFLCFLLVLTLSCGRMSRYCRSSLSGKWRVVLVSF